MKYFYIKAKDRVITIGYEWDKETNLVKVAPTASCSLKGRWKLNTETFTEEWIPPDNFSRKIGRAIVEGRAKKYGMTPFSFVAENVKILNKKLISIYHPDSKVRQQANEELRSGN